MITLREMFNQSDDFKVLPALPTPLGKFDYIVLTPSGHRWQVRDNIVFTESGHCFTCVNGGRGSYVIKNKGDRKAWIKLIEDNVNDHTSSTTFGTLDEALNYFKLHKQFT